jgi:hypothetical protein
MEFFLIGSLLFALIPAFIAKNKGRSFGLWYLYGLFLSFFAFLHALLIKPNEKADGMKKCPACASIISSNASVCPLCRTNFNVSNNNINKEINQLNKTSEVSDYQGERDVSSLQYQLYLTKRYNIEKNITLEKYIVSDEIFKDLDEAIKHCDELYSKFIINREVALEKESIKLKKLKEVEDYEKQQKINEAKFIKERKLIDDEKLRKEKLERDIIEAPIRESRRRKIIFLSSAASLFIISAMFFYYEEYKISENAKRHAQKIEGEKRVAEMNAALAKASADRDLKIKTDEKTKIIFNTKMKSYLTGGNYFGFKVGDNNIEKLIKNNSELIRKKLSSNVYYVECDEDRCNEVFDDPVALQFISNINFLFCYPEKEIKNNLKEYKMIGIEIAFLDDKNKYIGNYIKGREFLSPVPKGYQWEISEKYSMDLKWVANENTVIDVCGNKLKSK